MSKDVMLQLVARCSSNVRGGLSAEGTNKGGGRRGCFQCYTHWQVRILECIDDFLEEAPKGRATPLAISKLYVGILPCHPAGLGPQVAVGAVKAGHHIVQQQPLQLVLVRSLQQQADWVRRALSLASSVPTAYELTPKALIPQGIRQMLVGRTHVHGLLLLTQSLIGWLSPEMPVVQDGGVGGVVGSGGHDTLVDISLRRGKPLQQAPAS